MDSARRSVVDAAGELADDDHVGSVHQIVFQRRGIEQGFVGSNRAEVGVDAQDFANAEQAFFGTLFGWGLVEFGQSDGAHECGVGLECEVDGFLREGRAGFVDGDAA